MIRGSYLVGSVESFEPNVNIYFSLVPVVIVASHMATLPNLLQLMAPIFRLAAVFPVFADSFLQILLCPLHITAAVIILIGMGRNCRSQKQRRAQNRAQNCGSNHSLT